MTYQDCIHNFPATFLHSIDLGIVEIFQALREVILCSDLYWEAHYKCVDVAPMLSEPTDKLLPEYKLPEKIEEFIEQGRYNNMERSISKVCNTSFLIYYDLLYEPYQAVDSVT